MPLLSRAMQVLMEVPKHGKLAYCLLRDERIPRAPKALLLAALGVIVSPIDFPAYPSAGRARHACARHPSGADVHRSVPGGHTARARSGAGGEGQHLRPRPARHDGGSAAWYEAGCEANQV